VNNVADHRNEADWSALYRSLFEAYPDAMLLVDGDGCIVVANPAAQVLLGYAAEQLAGLSVDALVPDLARSRHVAYREAYASAPRPRPMGTQADLRARRGDGSEVRVEIALSPLTLGSQRFVVAAVRNIEDYPRVVQAQQRARYSEAVARLGRLAIDQREPEGLLRLVPHVAGEALQAQTAVLFLLEPDHSAFRVAAGMGLAPQEQIGMLVPNQPDTSPGYLLVTGEPTVIEDYRRETRFAVPPAYLAQGWISALAVPLVDRGRPLGALAVRASRPARFGHDEVHFLESLANLVVARLQRARDEAALQHAQRLDAVGQLTGGVAHDFNNLLTVIQGNLQLLEEHPALAADAMAANAVAAALRAGRRGAELTAKLLAFARRQVLMPAQVDVPALLRSLADMLRRTIDARIRIELSLDDACPPCLVDAAQLEAALLNLAINARDAMPGGGLLRLSAAASPLLPPDVAAELGCLSLGVSPYVLVSVADSGLGMTPEVRERAFEPFFTTKEKGRGTGLGLSTAYGFVSQSNGALRCESAPGAGTTMRLYLPAASTAPVQPAGSADSPTPPRLPAGLRVLLVEDEADVRTTVRQHLSALGCEVHDCATAEAAMQVLGDTQVDGARSAPAAPGAAGAMGAFDLVLSDVALGPGMRGTELAQRVRTRWPRLRVLLMSGYASGTPDGPAAVWPDLLRPALQKPFDRHQLARAMAAELAGRPG
jgi:PAS domain S-box-containing protein